MKLNLEHIYKRGINLKHLGVNAYAYSSSVILDLLAIVQANNLTILGEDVFFYKNDQLTHTYDNWYYEKHDPTSDCSKSILQTDKYIKHYLKNHGEHYYFSIVLEEPID